MPHDFQILVDSDAFVGRFYPDDSHHDRSLSIFGLFKKDGQSLVTTNLVLGETATVLSHRSGQALARKFLEVIRRSRLPVIHIDEKLQQQAIKVFEKQQKKGTSMTDCANVAVVKRFHIPSIFSFDKAYEKQFGLRVLN